MPGSETTPQERLREKLAALVDVWIAQSRYPSHPTNEWQRGERETLARCVNQLCAILAETADAPRS